MVVSLAGIVLCPCAEGEMGSVSNDIAMMQMATMQTIATRIRLRLRMCFVLRVLKGSAGAGV